MSENKTVLYYFRGRGRAEIARLTMAAGGVQFDEIDMVEVEQYETIKKEKKLLYGQLPMLEIDGIQLVQTGAIVRYIANRSKLMGSDEIEKAKIDVLYEGSRDFMGSFLMYGFGDNKKILESAKNQGLPKYLPIFEKVLAENGSNGYLFGSGLTLADVGLLEVVLSIEDYLGADELNAYPNIQKFLSTMKSNENIAAYLNGPKRNKIPDEAYVAEVRKVLRF